MQSESKSLLGELFFALAKNADTPVSLGLYLRFKYQEFAQLVTKDVNPLDYNLVDDFEKDYALVKYLSKYVDLETGINLDEVTISAWKQAEAQCFQTNSKLAGQPWHRGFDPRVERVLFLARRKIAAVVGECTYAEALAGCKWGPGSTYSLKGEAATLVDKIREFPVSVTRRALPYFKAVIESDPHWAEVLINGDKPYDDKTFAHVDGPFCLLACCFTTVPGCRATLVAKSAKTKRSIAIEPTGNIFLQLGVGGYLRSRLRRVGVDLDDQTWNQSLACFGSITGSVATLDLKAASDTVSRELIYDLFPLDFALLLEQIRSPQISWTKDSWLKLEKFSSMGNGFTFELESLIFWALTSAVVEDLGAEEALVGVYGDDIACPTECVPLLSEVLAACGFSVNKEKSHDVGYFRESCGNHYWDGIDVTPVYQKEALGTVWELYRAANRLYRYAFASDLGVHGGRRRPWIEPAWRCTVKFIGEYYYRLKGYQQLGYPKPSTTELNLCYMRDAGGHAIPFGDDSDDGLLLPLRWLSIFVREVDQDGRMKLPVLSFRPKKKRFFDDRSLLAYWLRFSPEEPFKGAVPVRRRGRYISRSRWFSTIMWVSDPATLDVAW